MTSIKQTLAAVVLVGGAMAAIGCNNHNATPPGPGPTAMPESYKGTQIQPGGPINSESRMGAGSGSTLQDQNH